MFYQSKVTYYWSEIYHELNVIYKTDQKLRSHAIARKRSKVNYTLGQCRTVKARQTAQLAMLRWSARENSPHGNRISYRK